MSQSLLTALAVLTGAMVPFQLAFNGQLGQALRSTTTGAMFVFLIGLLTLVAIALLTRAPLPDGPTLQAVPWTAWFGGLIAVAYIVAVVYLIPRLGVGSSAILIIAGQVLAALLLDHLGAFGMPQVRIDLPRLSGGLMVIGGAWLIRANG